MQDLFGSVRRSLVFNSGASALDEGGGGGRISGFVEKIGSSIRNSRVGLFSKAGNLALPPSGRRRCDDAPPIRWRKGELIGAGAFGRVYMGMNLDSGELLAVKQVLIAPGTASKDKTQEHIRELEEEVKLLKNLSHPNIVRYLGTVREEDSLNILMEFVPGGSISSLLGKFESFSESVIRRYTKQLLLGLEYLHKNKILHRDIKGANILVDNKGCIKLADFGASKKVVELATINGAKSMKGTPYWMAPEVIVQTGYSFSADIWSVGCTIIEMATGKPPWSQQYREEFAAMFHIGTTKSHPPIPEHLSPEAKDFLLKCLQKEPNLRPDASELLQHPFVAGGYNSVGVKDSLVVMQWADKSLKASSQQWCAATQDDDMCQIDDLTMNPSYGPTSLDMKRSFNPTNEPIDDGLRQPAEETRTFDEDDDEVTELKIRSFLDEKALELKKLQTPLYEQFLSTINGVCTATLSDSIKAPLKQSPKRLPSRRLSSAVEVDRLCAETSDRVLHEIQPRQHTADVPSSGFSEQKRIWEEELHQELERKRELMRKAGGKTPSPVAQRHKEKSRFAPTSRFL